MRTTFGDTVGFACEVPIEYRIFSQATLVVQAPCAVLGELRVSSQKDIGSF